MKKFLVIGNPIDHSLSPKLHNHWIKNNNIDAIYEKQQVSDEELRDLILKIKKKDVHGMNVTVPFKNKVIPYLDQLSKEAEKTKSVNTIFLKEDKIFGHNTDIEGFELSVRNINFDISKKEILILGAGGVVSSLIFALKKMNVSKINISNRTRVKAENLKNLFKDISTIDWGQTVNFDMIINATSIGLNKDEQINLNFSKMGKNKLFYDVIYNPHQTNFLKTAAEIGNMTVNGKMMFIYQAAAAFKIWHGIYPEINNNVIELVST